MSLSGLIGMMLVAGSIVPDVGGSLPVFMWQLPGADAAYFLWFYHRGKLYPGLRIFLIGDIIQTSISRHGETA